MYPRISDLFKDFLGFELPFPIYSYGLMVALAILIAGWISGKEVKRLQESGQIGKLFTNKKKNGKHVETALSAGDFMGTVMIIAAVAGVIGSKLFYILESPGGDILSKIFSTGGLTFYGGLIGGTIAVSWYVKKKNVNPIVFADAVAPSLILAYGIGRIGCHLAGDGDWGIQSNMALKPDWLPTWFWAEMYPNRIADGIIVEPGVYPTPLYEFLACVLIFAILWSIRKHPYKAGWLFSVYLVFNGLERFLIEKIRVNSTFSIFGIESTQAELISSILMLLGFIGIYLTMKGGKSRNSKKPQSEEKGNETDQEKDTD